MARRQYYPGELVSTPDGPGMVVRVIGFWDRWRVCPGSNVYKIVVALDSGGFSEVYASQLT